MHQKQTAAVIAVILTILTVAAATEIYSKGGSYHWPAFYRAGGFLIPVTASIFFAIYFNWTRRYRGTASYILGVIGIFTSLWWAPIVIMIGWAAILLTWILIGSMFS